ncbi:MAG: hypothetical protein LBJ00_15430 [Planctomycetaceae bacterium]|nr:hypothetical protein [Planctomycetaceae bacterium]
MYKATLKFLKLNAQAQQHEAVVQGRSLSPYWLRCITKFIKNRNGNSKTLNKI